jgi:hypothetical protein
LDVNGAVKISSTAGFDAFKFGKGLFAAYDSVNNEGEISSLDLTASNSNNWVYSNLTLNGGYLFLNQKQPSPNMTPEGKDKSKGNVAIGTLVGLLPKNQLDVAGSVAIGSGYAGKQTAQANGLLVEGQVGIGTTNPVGQLDIRDATNTRHLLQVNHDSTADWGYNTIFKVRSDNTKAIAVRKEKADEWNGTETFVLYGSGAVWANGSWRWSDKRWKEDIKPLQNTLDKVTKLQGVSYKWDKKTRPTNDDRTHIGFVAQEVETVLPEMVSTDEKGFKAVAYDEMSAILVEAVKELKAQNDALKTIVCKDHPGELICR